MDFRLQRHRREDERRGRRRRDQGGGRLRVMDVVGDLRPRIGDREGHQAVEFVPLGAAPAAPVPPGSAPPACAAGGSLRAKAGDAALPGERLVMVKQVIERSQLRGREMGQAGGRPAQGGVKFSTKPARRKVAKRSEPGGIAEQFGHRGGKTQRWRGEGSGENRRRMAIAVGAINCHNCTLCRSKPLIWRSPCCAGFKRPDTPSRHPFNCARSLWCSPAVT